MMVIVQYHKQKTQSPPLLGSFETQVTYLLMSCLYYVTIYYTVLVTSNSKQQNIQHKTKTAKAAEDMYP